MVRIRVYFMPKGYTDIICDSVIYNNGNNTVKIIGGKEDGVIYNNCAGARMLRLKKNTKKIGN